MDAQQDLGTYYADEKNDYKKAIYWYEKAVEQDGYEANCELGWLLYYGKVGEVEPQPERAIEVLKRGAELNYGHSIQLLADIYLDDENGFKNVDKGIELHINNVKDNQNGVSALRLAELYFTSKYGFEKDKQTGLELVELAKRDNAYVDAELLKKWLSESEN